ncbi:MAG TPA: hypothetical protein VGT41_03520 [Candidatus Babeliales bacterium]|nr:hypothetical protein [Candidatus Babeliales bacterium]
MGIKIKLFADKSIQSLQQLWNAFDPIGVYEYSEWPDDEYLTYVYETADLFEKGVTFEQLYAYVCDVVRNRIGLSSVSVSDTEIVDFVRHLQAWYDVYK